jgi:ABC-type branched-subunit amino acid transport system substrate-binding protein
MLGTRAQLRGVVIAAALVLLAAAVGSAAAQGNRAQPYVVGMTIDSTGAGSSGFEPLGQAMRIFFANLDAKGGIRGHAVRLLVRDNKGEDGRLASDFKYFERQHAVVVYYAAPASTIATFEGAADRTTPVIYGGSCYPPATRPDPARNFFCVGVSPVADAHALVNAVIRHFGSSSAVKLADAPSDLPGSRHDALEVINPYAQSRGATVVDTQIISMSTTDVMPVARKFVQEGVNAIISFGASSHAVALAGALKQLRWKGYFISVSYTPGIMTAMARIKSPTWYTLDWFASPTDDDPATRELRKAAATYHATDPVADLRLGWSGGMMIQRALKECHWPCGRSTLTHNLNDIWVRDPDWNRFFGHSLWWTQATHTARVKAWRVYRFDPHANRIEVATDWFTGGDPGCGHVDVTTEKTAC